MRLNATEQPRTHRCSPRHDGRALATPAARAAVHRGIVCGGIRVVREKVMRRGPGNRDGHGAQVCKCGAREEDVLEPGIGMGVAHTRETCAPSAALAIPLVVHRCAPEDVRWRTGPEAGA